MLQAHGADAATWTVMGDDCISMGRSKGLPEDLLHELARNQAASTRRRDFRGDERAVRAQEEHAKHCSCCQRRRSEAGAGDEPPALEDAVVELAVALGAAAADSDEALSAALLSATGLDTPILRHAIEFSLRIGATEGGDEAAVATTEAAMAVRDDTAPPAWQSLSGPGHAP